MSPPILSPCIGICSLDEEGYCEGCFRTGEEIAGWAAMSEVERCRWMDEVLLEREARRGA